MAKRIRQARLPNGSMFHYYNKLEMLYLYEEIFTNGEYQNDLIDYQDGSVVVDVGANIGLFIHYLTQTCKNTKIYSIEPIPDLMDVLAKNAELVGDHEIYLFNFGLSNESGTAVFHFLPNCTARSTMHVHGSPLDMSPAARVQEKETTLQIFKDVPDRTLAKAIAMLPAFARSWLALGAMRLHAKSKEITCVLKTLSQFIDENQLEAIDILKIDVEGCEAEILRGIDEKDWPRIRQIIIEVHEQSGEVFDEVVSMIDRHGFQRDIERSSLNQLPMIYASR